MLARKGEKIEKLSILSLQNTFVQVPRFFNSGDLHPPLDPGCHQPRNLLPRQQCPCRQNRKYCNSDSCLGRLHSHNQRKDSSDKHGEAHRNHHLPSGTNDFPDPFGFLVREKRGPWSILNRHWNKRILFDNPHHQCLLHRNSPRAPCVAQVLVGEVVHQGEGEENNRKDEQGSLGEQGV